jgi:glycosyltransferase involved in cell wall biosynthesis
VKVLMLSKALVVGVYQRKLEELAALPGVDLLAVVPPYWLEERVGVLPLERLHTRGYRLVARRMWFNGHHHVHLYPGLWNAVRRFRPDIVHVDEEPYNLVTLQASLLARLFGAQVLFFTWQNLYRRYPPPFSLFERANYRLAAWAVAGNQEAAEVLRRKGYRGPLMVIPQFGVDPEFYRPFPLEKAGRLPTIGYVGRLVPEKGIADLIDAFARMRLLARLEIVGNGSERERLHAQASERGVAERVLFRGGIPAAEMPGVYSGFDVLVVPSRSRPNWKEQFGRVIIEAMACELPVIGSDSGEIPNVIGNGGRVYPEGDVERLAAELDDILGDEPKRREVALCARERVLAEFTQARVAERYYDVYRSILAGRGDGDPLSGRITEAGVPTDGD